MKIALVTMRTDPARGGAERYTTDLAAALVALGHEVSLLAAQFARVPQGVRIVSLRARALTRAGRFRGFLDRLDAHLREHRYDVVHAMLPVRQCDAYHPHAGVVAATMGGGASRWPWSDRRRALIVGTERALLQRADGPVVLCLSRYVRRQVESHYTLDASRMPIVFNAVDTDYYDPARAPGARAAMRERWGVGDADCAAVFVGQDFERKGLREAIQALAVAVRRPGGERLVLVIVGRPRGERHLALARELGVLDRIRKVGHIEDTHGVYRAADLLVLPTRHDPCSLVVLEGLAMGVPVISTRFNGACEIMTPGEHGAVLDDPTDVQALADALLDFSGDERRRAASAACLALRPRLAYPNHLDALLAAYDRISASRPGPAAA